MQPYPTSTTPTQPGGALVAVGGALLGVGAFLHWVELSGGGTSASSAGTDVLGGWIALTAGIVAAVGGLLLLQTPRARTVAIVAGLASLVGGGLALFAALTVDGWGVDAIAERIASEFGGRTAVVRVVLQGALDAGDVDLSPGAGLFIAIVGGVLGVVGAAIALRRASEPPAPVSADTRPIHERAASAIPGAPPAAPAPPPSPWVTPPRMPEPPPPPTPPSERPSDVGGSPTPRQPEPPPGPDRPPWTGPPPDERRRGDERDVAEGP